MKVQEGGLRINDTLACPERRLEGLAYHQEQYSG